MSYLDDIWHEMSHGLGLKFQPCSGSVTLGVGDKQDMLPDTAGQNWGKLHPF